MLSAERQMADLNRAVVSAEQHRLAFMYRPHIMLDEQEPFFPVAVGYTVFETDGQSPSSRYDITFDRDTQYVIEYAIWWDWDIEHLYELEHIWIHIDTNGTITTVEASAHGKRLLMPDVTLTDGLHPVLYAAPGKHAFASHRDALLDTSAAIDRACKDHAGIETIAPGKLFLDSVGHIMPLVHRLAKRYLQQRAFAPTYRFARVFDLGDVPLVPWPNLREWIPARLRWWFSYLLETQPHLAVVCLDSGDTLIDEATEIKDENGVTQTAELIPGADELVRTLKKEGYTLALVVDGPRGTFENTLGHVGLFDLFDAHAISRDLGVEKPAPEIFRKALDTLDIQAEDYRRCVMVGNYLARDIQGANQLGMISVWLDWSPRRPKIPATDSQIPDYVIKTPLELLAVLQDIELAREL